MCHSVKLMPLKMFCNYISHSINLLDNKAKALFCSSYIQNKTTADCENIKTYIFRYLYFLAPKCVLCNLECI